MSGFVMMSQRLPAHEMRVVDIIGHGIRIVVESGQMSMHFTANDAREFAAALIARADEADARDTEAES